MADIVFNEQIVGTIALSEHTSPKVAQQENILRAAHGAFEIFRSLPEGTNLQDFLTALALSLDLPKPELVQAYFRQAGLMHVAAGMDAADICPICSEAVEDHAVSRDCARWRLTTLCTGQPVRYQVAESARAPFEALPEQPDVPVWTPPETPAPAATNFYYSSFENLPDWATTE